MRENRNWKKLLWPFSVVEMLGVIYMTETAGMTTIRDKNYGMVLDYTLEGRRGLPSKDERIYGVSQIWKKHLERVLVIGHQMPENLRLHKIYIWEMLERN